jgi:hypothetical protein
MRVERAAQKLTHFARSGAVFGKGGCAPPQPHDKPLISFKDRRLFAV